MWGMVELPSQAHCTKPCSENSTCSGVTEIYLTAAMLMPTLQHGKRVMESIWSGITAIPASLSSKSVTNL